jgi:myo-inositol-1(or 4)-monophosphatase
MITPPVATADDLALATAVTEVAAEMALGHFNARSEWWEKAPGDPVGVADLEVDAYLKAALIGARLSA